MKTEVHRMCISTMEVLPIRDMIRFVISPDGIVTPDIKGKLPGRGIWVKADKESIQYAIQKNKFSRAAKASVQCPNDLVECIDRLLLNRIMEFISLGRRSNTIVNGFEKVKEILKSHEASIILMKSDEQADSAKKIIGMCKMLNVEYFTNMAFLDNAGTILHSDNVVYIGVKSGGIAQSLQYEIRRFEMMV